MSIRLRCKGKSTRTRSFGWAWVTSAETENGHCEKIRYGYAPTWHEAMNEAHAALEVISQELMDEVHASRSRRRVLAGQSLGGSS